MDEELALSGKSVEYGESLQRALKRKQRTERKNGEAGLQPKIQYQSFWPTK